MDIRDYFSSGYKINSEKLAYGYRLDAINISGRILHAYYRYMIRKYNLGAYSHYSMPSVPYFSLYLKHITGLILRAISLNKNPKNEKFNDKIIWPSSGCIEIDILCKRFIKRKYKLDVSLKRFSIKHLNSKGYYFKSNRVGILYLIKHLVGLYRPINKDINFKIKYLKEKENNFDSLIFLGHDTSDTNAPFNYLPDEIENYLGNKNIKFIKILPQEVGIKNHQRIYSFLLSLYKGIRFFKRGKLINLKDLHFLFFYFASIEYKNNLVNVMNKLNVKFLITAYFDLIYGPVFTRAAKVLKIKHFTFCFSMGYPFVNRSLLRYSFDTRRYSDIIFANSKFRYCQYINATSHLLNPPKIDLHTCPQIEYSQINSSKNIFKINAKNKFNLAIVDNLFAKDLFINEYDVESIFQILPIFKKEISLIIQSKKQDFLKNNMKKYYADLDIAEVGKKSDLSSLKKADLVLSIGFQGAALKACAVFDKPLLIFTKKRRDLTYSKFSNIEKENNLIRENLDFLWNDEKSHDHFEISN